MQSVLTSAMACVVGALETAESTDGAFFHRTPRAARVRMTDPFLNYHSSVTSGVRIEALTDSSVLEIDVELQHMALPGVDSNSSTFDLVIADELRDPVRTSDERLILLDPATRKLQLQIGKSHHPAVPPRRRRRRAANRDLVPCQLGSENARRPNLRRRPPPTSPAGRPTVGAPWRFNQPVVRRRPPDR